MRCVLLLSALAVAAPAAHISSSVRASSDGRGTSYTAHHSSDGPGTSYTAHQFSDGGGLGLRSSFGSGAGPQPLFTLGFRDSFRPASISEVRARLNNVAEDLNETMRRMQR